jgi:hypothetical protein
MYKLLAIDKIILDQKLFSLRVTLYSLKISFSKAWRKKFSKRLTILTKLVIKLTNSLLTTINKMMARIIAELIITGITKRTSARSSITSITWNFYLKKIYNVSWRITPMPPILITSPQTNMIYKPSILRNIFPAVGTSIYSPSIRPRPIEGQLSSFASMVAATSSSENGTTSLTI